MYILLNLHHFQDNLSFGVNEVKYIMELTLSSLGSMSSASAFYDKVLILAQEYTK